MTHIGKIGRLPKDCRHELGHRIENGQPGTEIVRWLNAHPEVREILDAQFAGRPISEQNLSDWKQSGHLEWLRRQEVHEAALGLVERADELDETTGNRHLSDRFATVLAAEMTRLAAALLEPDSDPEKRWPRLCQIHRELSQLRRDDHRAMRIAIQRERWDLEAERDYEAEAERQKKAHNQRMIDMLLEGKFKHTNAEMIFGGGEAGRNMAEMLYRLKCDLPIDDLYDGTWQGEGTACPRNPPPTPPVAADVSSRTEKSCPPTPAKAEPAAKPSAKPRFGAKPTSDRTKKPAKPQKSSLIKANPGEIASLNPIAPASFVTPSQSDSAPIKSTDSGIVDHRGRFQ